MHAGNAIAGPISTCETYHTETCPGNQLFLLLLFFTLKSELIKKICIDFQLTFDGAAQRARILGG